MFKVWAVVRLGMRTKVKRKRKWVCRRQAKMLEFKRDLRTEEAVYGGRWWVMNVQDTFIAKTESAASFLPTRIMSTTQS